MSEIDWMSFPDNYDESKNVGMYVNLNVVMPIDYASYVNGMPYQIDIVNVREYVQSGEFRAICSDNFELAYYMARKLKKILKARICYGDNALKCVRELRAKNKAAIIPLKPVIDKDFPVK